MPIPTPRSVDSTTYCDALLLASGVTTQQVGSAVQISCTTAGTVTLTLWSGATIILNAIVGSTIYPYQVQSYLAGTAVGLTVYNLFR